jgi:hypothetical protein
MTLDEKVAMLHGVDGPYGAAMTALHSPQD